MVKVKKPIFAKYVVGILGFTVLLFLNAPLDAASSEEVSVTFLNPFSLQTIQVQPRVGTNVVVLRSTQLRTASSVPNQQLPLFSSSLTLQSSDLVFRNSVVRIPLMPEVRSPSSPD
jgi:hypothetical protein